MKKQRLILPLALLASSLGSTSLLAQDYNKIHQNAILVDTHNDVLIAVMKGQDISKDLTGKTHSDLARFKQGGVDAQFFSVWSDETGTFAYANQQIDSLQALVKRNPGQLMLANNVSDIRKAVKAGKMAALIGVEGGHMIEDDIKKLEQLHQRGTRYLTLTWNNSTSWATSAMDEGSGKLKDSEKGLNELGRKIVQRMNALGMMVDLSHVGEKTFWDVMAITKKPVLVSHSSVYGINPVFRNLNDKQIKAVAKNKGVIQLNFYSGFLDPNFTSRLDAFNEKHKAEIDSLKANGQNNEAVMNFLTKTYPKQVQELRPPLSLLLDHLDYIVKLVGVDYVGMGSDFDGISSAPQQLDGVQNYPLITKELLARGYSEKDIKKILGENMLRVFKANAG